MASSVILPLDYLPSIAWFYEYANADNVLLEKHENFAKGKCRNRCTIAGPNGKQQLSIPIIGGRDHHQLFIDTRICYNTAWNLKHQQSLQTAYGSSPFFEHYSPIIFNLYQQKPTHLWQCNENALSVLLRLLKIPAKHQYTTVFQKQYDNYTDWRYVKEMSLQYAPGYYQPFSAKHGFVKNASIIDLLFNEGPVAKDYLYRHT